MCQKRKGLISGLLLLCILFGAGGSECNKGKSTGTSTGSSYIPPLLPPPVSAGWFTTSNPSPYWDQATRITMDDTYLFIGGSDGQLGGWDNLQWRIEKRGKAIGELVTAFGTNGVVISNPSSRPDTVNSIIVQDNYLYIGGQDYSPGEKDSQWRIEKRDKTTGALVSGFGTNGVITSNPGFENLSVGDTAENVTCLILDDNYLYISGIDRTLDQWRIEKRDKTTGALVTGFGTNGVLTSNPSDGNDDCWSITADNNYLYLAGSEISLGGDWQWRIEKRNKTTGALVSGFGTNGVVTNNPSDEMGFINSIAVDNNYFYLTGTTERRMEKRDKTTGGLIGDFGINGVINDTIGVRSIIIDNNYLYTCGQSDFISPNDRQWLIEKRDKTTGALVAGFGTNGVLTINPSNGEDGANFIIADNTYLYIVGYDEIGSPGSNNNYQWRIEKINKITGGQ
jgi:hypothetical protein